MTSRRCTVLEQGACEQLKLNGYEVRVLPSGLNKGLPPAHLIASRLSGETRYIRIRKISHRSANADTMERFFMQDIIRYRSEVARHPMNSTIRYEVWLYTLQNGYNCFEILPDRIQEIPLIAGRMPERVFTGETP